MSKKWTDAKPAEKLLSLYTLLLFSHKEISLSELSVALECSKQSVSRLIVQLEGSRFGKILRTQRGREALFRLERPKQLPQISLGADGLAQLALCREFLLHLLPPAMHIEMKHSLQQASAFLPEKEQFKPIDIGGRLRKGSIDYSPFQGVLDTLIQAIRENNTCSVQYKASLHGTEKHFDYAPKRLLVFHESILIAGWIVETNDRVAPVYESPTRLSLQRIITCLGNNKSTEHLPPIPESDSASFGIMGGESFAATIQFSPNAATYISERQWSMNQTLEHNSDGSVTLNLTVQSLAECISWILSFGVTATVLSPDWLRDKIKQVALGLVYKY